MGRSGAAPVHVHMHLLRRVVGAVIEESGGLVKSGAEAPHSIWCRGWILGGVRLVMWVVRGRRLRDAGRSEG